VAALATHAVGRGHIELTRVGLGGVEIGPEEGESADLARAVRVLTAAADAGINWIDTAEDYYETRNETLIGEALARCDASFHVATKVGPNRGNSGFRPEQVRAACHASMRRLRRDHVDLYFLHWPDDVVPLEETWGAMSDLVEEGLVGAIGLSNFDIADIERCHAQRAVDLVQDGLSLVDHLDARERFSRCAELGVPVVAYEPLAGGVLSGRTMEEVREIWQGLDRVRVLQAHAYAWPSRAKRGGHRGVAADRQPARHLCRAARARLGTSPTGRGVGARREPRR
jgi:hypothetical protein